ncbi:glycoside hydrolase family 75 protein [Streptomyces sp. NPDC002889]|uniref:glycoside hydrolase family 75 protein n=1 Tax=Streptomyces sp. NPDC002889 TaxID=3364669 RepID=UPI00368A453E
MRIRHTVLAATGGAALMAVAALPAAADPAVPPPAPPNPVFRTEATRQEAATEAPVTASQLLDKVTRCTQISRGKYRSDQGAAAKIPVCDAKGAVFWKADMDIDCDGQPTVRCNRQTDPYFQPTTAFQQSDGAQLNAEKLPFIVVPGPSSIWDYRVSGIRGGSVAAVIYKNKVQYAVVGDTGPTGIIGEASYATAKALGIDPHPSTGGAASGVTYIVFKQSRVSPIESRNAALTLGKSLARSFVKNN